jgi:hypothetical protein
MGDAVLDLDAFAERLPAGADLLQGPWLLLESPIIPHGDASALA